MRLLAIGDIHGCFHALDTLAQQVGFTNDDVVVTIGDYVDRGPQSREVIDFLIHLGGRLQLISLRGNHEVMMLQARQDPGAFRDWLACGGASTVESYGTTSLDSISEEHWDFINATKPYHVMEHDFFVHASAHPEFPMAAQPEWMLYWEKFNSPAPHSSGKRMICGHTPQKDGKPLNIGHAVCIDTWVYGPGWLTCLDVTSGIYWQANQRGQSRRDVLSSA